MLVGSVVICGSFLAFGWVWIDHGGVCLLTCCLGCGVLLEFGLDCAGLLLCRVCEFVVCGLLVGDYWLWVW